MITALKARWPRSDHGWVEKSERARPRLRIPKISVRYVAEGSEGVGRLVDVSKSGLYIRARDLPRPNAIVAVQFESPVGKLVDARGQVRWNSSEQGAAPDGFGVKLYEPPIEFREFVTWVLSQSEKWDDDEEAFEDDL